MGKIWFDNFREKLPFLPIFFTWFDNFRFSFAKFLTIVYLIMMEIFKELLKNSKIFIKSSLKIIYLFFT